MTPTPHDSARDHHLLPPPPPNPHLTAPGLRKAVLSAMLRGTYAGALLAAMAFLCTQGFFREGGEESGWSWGQLWHFVFDGALLVGMANGIAHLLAPSSWPWHFFGADNAAAPAGWRARIGRWLDPLGEGPLLSAFLGVVCVVLFTRGGPPLSDADRGLALLLFIPAALCVLHLLGLLVILFVPDWRRLPRVPQPTSAGSSEMDAGGLLAGVGPMGCPVVGYLLGAASGWSLAPQYGIMLGVAAEILLSAFRWSLVPADVKGGAEPA